jgi:hypothetical protein
MPNKKWGVAKVKGSRPEQFFIFLALHRSIVRASHLLSEEGLRSDLANRGIKEAEIEALIEHAPSLTSAHAQPQIILTELNQGIRDGKLPDPR